MKLRTRILAIVAVPLIGLGLVAGMDLAQALSSLRAANELNARLHETVLLGDLVHELQVERGLSAGFLSSGGRQFDGALSGQRRTVDGLVERLGTGLPKLAADRRDEVAGLQRLLDEVRGMREQVSGLSVKPPEMAAVYTAAVRAALDLTSGVFTGAGTGAIGLAGAARASLGEAKEAAGLERATGAVGFSSGGFTVELRSRFAALVAVQEAELSDTVELAGPSIPGLDLRAFPEHDDIEAMRAPVLASGDVGAVQGPEWFATATAWIERLRAVDKDLAEVIGRAADEEVEGARAEVMMLAAIGGLAALAGGVGLLQAQRIARALGRIGQAMDRVAQKDFVIEIPDSGRGDEIGAIARDLIVCRDRLAQGEAAAQMALFKAQAFAGSSAAMMLVDRDMTVVDYNQSLVDLYRDNLDDLRAKWPDFDPDALRGINVDRFHRDPAHQRRILSDPSNLPYSSDISLGAARLHLEVAAICDDAGEMVGASLQWRDVRQERTNASLLNAIKVNQTMAEYDTGFRIGWTNEMFGRVFGWGEEALGKTLEDLFGPNEDTQVQMERLSKGQKVTRKVERRSKDGSSRWIEVAMNPIMDKDGRLDRIIEIGADVTKLEQVRIDAEAERERTDAAQRLVVEELRRGLSALADGDLTQELARPFAPEMEALRNDYNSACAKLTEAVTSLIASSSNIGSGASEIAQASDDLSRRTETQAATLEETAAALDQMTASVRSTAEGAQEADQAVVEARAGAEASGRVVVEAVEAMGEIEKSAGQISQIIGVIDDIAFQTNLLALNAGVEAARAGEAGRGFAVVASEVRGLAQRSSDAAKEIKTLIQASSQHVERGVDLVGQTGEALKKIVESVVHVSDLVSRIAGASSEQSSGISEINTGVNQLDQVTQQNAAMVQEATAASHSLRQEAETLGAIVGRFRVAGIDPLPQRAGTKGAGTKAPAEGSRAFSGGPTTSPPPRLAATGTDGWQDF